MAVDTLKLYWKKQLVGVITNATWSDFPWIAGRFESRRVSKRLRAVLVWFATQAEKDEFENPPFDDDLIENWAIVKPDRTRVELLLPPTVDFIKGVVGWRE